MTNPHPMAALWRGDIQESLHYGHAVIFDRQGGIVASWGDPDLIIYPRSSVKMIQALPLVESGAADRWSLGPEHLALASSSHIGAAMHTTRVSHWLQDLGLDDDALRCGPQAPRESADRKAMILAGETPCQMHNNCSGKHAGFLTLGAHLGGSAEYIDPDHPVQKAVRAAFEDVTGQQSPGFGIDGCSAPNFATSLTALARAMAFFTGPDDSLRGQAAARIRNAMATHPELVAGTGRCCTELMHATGGRAIVKTGAEGVFVGMLPGPGLGIALKISDGGTRASELAITTLLVHLGILDAADPVAQKYMNAPEPNRRGIIAAHLRPASGFPGNATDLKIIRKNS